MAIPFLNNINLDDNQLLNAKLHVTSSAPTAAVGQIYFDSTQTPDIIDTAKYYANSTDTWVSLKEYSFPAVAKADGYITSTITGTTAKPIVEFDLNATGTADSTTYLRGDNQWEPISAIPGTYEFTLSDNASPTPVSGIVAEDDTVTIAATSDLTSNLTGQATTSKLLTLGLKVDGGVGVSDNYVVNQGTAVAKAVDTIPFNDYTDNGGPTLDTDIVKKTTFGTIPVTALTEVKTYIDNAVAGGLIYQGGFDGSTGFVTGTSDYLDNRTGNNQIAVNKGWTYTVTTAGTFYGEVVEVGDVLIAEEDLASGAGALSDWTTVQNNVDLASLTQVGIGNVNAATAVGLDGLSVTYLSGTATVGLDINNLTNFSINPISGADLNSLEIPLYNGDTNDTNEKIDVATLLSAASSQISYANTITDSVSGTTFNHGLGEDVIVQLYDATTKETVYADVQRNGNYLNITFATTPTNSIRVLVQKIG